MHTDPQASAASFTHRLTVAVAGVVLVAGLALTAAGYRWVAQGIEAEAQTRFDNHATRVEEAIKQRFTRPLAGFHGLRSFMEASRVPVGREDFRAWIESRDMAAEFPGVRGIGFIERVARGDLASFIRTERADGATDFDVKSSGHDDEMYVIKYIEPLANNKPAWGLDVGAESVRREAVRRAIHLGDAALTGTIVLVQDGQQRPGFLYLLPIYRPFYGKRPSTPQQRAASLRGLIYAPLVLAELMDGVNAAADRLLEFEIVDWSDGTEGRSLYDQHTAAECHPTTGKATASHCMGHEFSTVKHLQIGGRTLTAVIRSTPDFEVTIDNTKLRWVALAGLALSTLMAALVWLIGAGRARSIALAEKMTTDLRQATSRMETALRDNAALLSALDQHALVSVTDRTGRITEANDAFCRISGYSHDELIGQNHRIVNSGTHSPDFWREMWRTIARGTPWHGELCNRAKDGSLYWVDTFIAPFVDSHGKVEKYISIRTDITASKAAAQQLAIQTERFELAIEGSNEGLWDLTDVAGPSAWWSPQYYRLLGYEPNEMPAGAESLEKILHRDHHASTREALRAALAGRREFNVEQPMLTKRGEYRWFRVRAKVFRDAEGRATRVAGSLQDIHEERMAKEQLRERSEQLDAIFSLSPDGFVSFDGQSQVNLVSPTFTHLTGMRAEQLLGLDGDAFLQKLGGLCSAATRIASFADLRRTDGGARVVLEMLPPAKRMLQVTLRESKHGAVGKVLHLHDVTHESEVDRMKSEFLSMAAHELRTPMTSIFGFSELLLHRDMPPAKQKDLLARIHRHSLMVTEILNELLDLARIEARKSSDFVLAPTDLCALVAEVVDDFQPPDGRSGPELTTEGEARWTRIDRNKMRQAILNLLSNAYKYSPEGGHVEVLLVDGQRGDRPCHGLRIVDHGIGLSPDQLARVGERFYRADKSGRIPGTGLGVSLVKQIVELMGGELSIQSAVGIGTEVTIWVPVTSAHDLEATRAPRAALLAH